MSEINAELAPYRAATAHHAAVLTNEQIKLAIQLANKHFSGAGDNPNSPFLAAVLTALATNYHAFVHESK
ncbi:hypothetical protein [Azohydromonas lata]|uniref:hypothetical protein n=1 Tax=Azohydromonas lata TaxID=45677 RepID=UPI0012F4D0BE|nr:hypothetical protein [Azohydromonas lata]